MSPPRINDDSLTVVVRREGAADLGPFDFDVSGVSVGVKKALKAAFESKVRPGGGWAAPSSVHYGFRVAITFAQEIVAANPRLNEIGDLTAGMLHEWSRSGHWGFAPSEIEIRFVRALLNSVDGLRGSTREYLVGRRQTLQPHSAEEQELLVDGAWEMTGGAVRRVRDNLEVRDCYRSGGEPAGALWGEFRGYGRCTVGEFLDHLSREGDVPGSVYARAKGLQEFLQIPGRRLRDALFLSQGELFALRVLFVVEGGYPPELLYELEVGDLGTSEAAIAAHVKKDGERLGSPGCSQDALLEPRAHLHAIAVFLTQPAREALAALGHPTDLLFVRGNQSRRSGDPARRFVSGTSLRAAAPRGWERLTGVQWAEGRRPTLLRLTPAPSADDTHGTEVISLRVSGENGSDYDDFSDLSDVRAWVESLISAFRRLTDSGGRWQSRDAARAGAGVLRRIAREMTAAYPHVDAIDDITARMLGEWCAKAISSAHGRRDSTDIAHALFREARSWVGAATADGGAAPGAGSGRTASLPEAGWDPRQQDVGEELVVTATGAGGALIDFRAFDVPHGLLVPFVDLFRRETALGGKWRSRLTVKVKVSEARRFLREITAVNPDLSAIGDLTPEMWWAWVHPEQGSGPADNVVASVIAMLKGIEGLTDTTRRVVQRHHVQRKESHEPAYRVSVARAFWDAAQEMNDETGRRIGPNRARLALYLSGQEPPDSPKYRIAGEWWSGGSYLNYVFRHGMAPSNTGRATNERLRAELRVAPGVPLTSALFLTRAEIYSLMMTFTYAGGENLSVLDGMEPGSFRADDLESDPPILMVEYDKPRRGAGRLSWEALIGRHAGIREVAEFLTEPAREALAALGHPTNRLFIGFSPYIRSKDPARRFIADWSDISSRGPAAWTKLTGVTDDDGKRPNLRRLRRTHQVMFEVPRQNTLQTHWNVYRRDDPQTLERAATILPDVEARIIEDAKTHERKMRILRTTDASAAPEEVARALDIRQERVQPLVDGDHDTALVACPDMYQSPFGEPGQRCPVVSYRTCLGCPCAIMTDRNLPGVVTYRDELVATTRHLTDKEWQEGYGKTFDQIEDALEQWTPEEVAAGRGAATVAHVTVARALLDSDRGA